MSTANPLSANALNSYVTQTARCARQASRQVAQASGRQKHDWLLKTAELLNSEADAIIAANRADLTAAPGFGLSAAATDRLRLDAGRIAKIAQAVHEVAALPDPVGEIIEGSVRPNGLNVSTVRVPLGVVFFIYESRPNVTVDAAALCIKSGNAVILRGGKEALNSNIALHQICERAASEVGLPAAAVQLVNTIDREAVGLFLSRGDLIDVTIPRGGKSLIQRVAAEARMPVIKHLDGICHVYVDAAADCDMARQIILNAKTQRPGVCNAAETLLVHASIAPRFLPSAIDALKSAGVEIRACDQTRQFDASLHAADDSDWATEYLDLILNVKIVDSLQSAIDHIGRYGSQHTDAIVTGDLAAARRFEREVDSAAVVVNASTRFNDGGELGLGAEIGISTDKFHARGPCGLRALTSYKYLVRGDGQIRT